MIELENISKEYTRGNRAFMALRDISLSIRKGDYCTVVGSSGAGKSTLLYIVGGLIHPDSGHVLYNGSDIYNIKPRDQNIYRKMHLGFVFQQFYLMPYLTVYDNIKLTCHNSAQIENIDYYLEKFSLGGMKSKYPSELSVGEKQRTAFIRAIITSPELLLADEPTGNLDPGNSEMLLNLIDDYHKNNGTVILVTHDPSISKFSRINIILEKGKIHRIDTA